MNGAFSLLFHMPSWRAQLQLHPYGICHTCVFALWAVLIPNDRKTLTPGQQIEWCHAYSGTLVQISQCRNFPR